MFEKSKHKTWQYFVEKNAMKIQNANKQAKADMSLIQRSHVNSLLNLTENILCPILWPYIGGSLRAGFWTGNASVHFNDYYLRISPSLKLNPDRCLVAMLARYYSWMPIGSACLLAIQRMALNKKARPLQRNRATLCNNNVIRLKVTKSCQRLISIDSAMLNTVIWQRTQFDFVYYWRKL